MTNDEIRLVQAAQSGSEAALTTLYQQHKTKIYSYALQRVGRDPDLAEEITADVFLRMVDKLATFKPHKRPLLAWLYTIAHNRVIDYYRATDRVELQSLSPLIADHAPLPAEQVADRYDIERIMSALDELTVLQRDVLNLRFVGGYSVRETAELLGRNESAIKTLTRRAIVAVQRQLRREVRYG